jgi:acyl carrier protein
VIKTVETIEQTVRDVIRDVLGVSQSRVDLFDQNTALFGSLPELDSMAVANLLTELEDRLGIIIDDEDVDGDMLGDLGGLVSFAVRKVNG